MTTTPSNPIHVFDDGAKMYRMGERIVVEDKDGNLVNNDRVVEYTRNFMDQGIAAMMNAEHKGESSRFLAPEHPTPTLAVTSEKEPAPLDWDGLKESTKGSVRHETLMAFLPEEAPPRVMDGLTPGIHPVFGVVDSMSEISPESAAEVIAGVRELKQDVAETNDERLAKKRYYEAASQVMVGVDPASKTAEGTSFSVIGSTKVAADVAHLGAVIGIVPTVKKEGEVLLTEPSLGMGIDLPSFQSASVGGLLPATPAPKAEGTPRQPVRVGTIANEAFRHRHGILSGSLARMAMASAIAQASHTAPPLTELDDISPLEYSQRLEQLKSRIRNLFEPDDRKEAKRIFATFRSNDFGIVEKVSLHVPKGVFLATPAGDAEGKAVIRWISKLVNTKDHTSLARMAGMSTSHDMPWSWGLFCALAGKVMWNMVLLVPDVYENGRKYVKSEQLAMMSKAVDEIVLAARSKPRK